MSEDTVDKIETLLIPLEKLRLVPGQNHRIRRDQLKQEQLKQSIKADCQRDPITVRPDGNFYQIIDGEGRYMAAKELGITHVKATVRYCSDVEASILSLSANLTRADINPLEIANGLQYAMSKGAAEQKLCCWLGWVVDGKPDTIRFKKYMNLLNLSEEVRIKVASGMVTETAAFEISRMSEYDQKRLVKKAEEIANKEVQKKIEEAKKAGKPIKPQLVPTAKVSERVIREAKKTLAIQVGDKFIGNRRMKLLEAETRESEKITETEKALLLKVYDYIMGRKTVMPL